MKIAGLSAVVTGGASGLGGAVAQMLASEGAKVTIFDLNATLGEAKAQEIGGRFALVNVTDEAGVDAALLEAEQHHGKARILVNCAGIGPPAKVIGKDGKAQPLRFSADMFSFGATPHPPEGDLGFAGFSSISSAFPAASIVTTP